MCEYLAKNSEGTLYMIKSTLSQSYTMKFNMQKMQICGKVMDKRLTLII
jgi:hypothetical protein